MIIFFFIVFFLSFISSYVITYIFFDFDRDENERNLIKQKQRSHDLLREPSWSGVTHDVTYGWTAMRTIQSRREQPYMYNEGYGVTGGCWSGRVSSDSHVGLLSGPPHRYLQLPQNSPQFINYRPSPSPSLPTSLYLFLSLSFFILFLHSVRITNPRHESHLSSNVANYAQLFPQPSILYS